MKYLKKFENDIVLYYPNNKLTTLKGLDIPKYVDGDFECDGNNLTSLEFGPEYVGGKFDCTGNKLKSLNFCPDFVGGGFECGDNNWTKPIPYETIKKYNIDTGVLYNHEQYERFSTYEYQKKYLTESPEKYLDLLPFGFGSKIKEEFDWLFNAIDMKLM